MRTSSSLVHPLKVSLLIFVNCGFSGKTKLSSCIQLLKAPGAIVVTVSGRVMLVRELHSIKALTPISVTAPLNSMLLMLVAANV